MRRLVGWGIGALALGCVLTACSREDEQALRVGNGTEPQGLDPHTVTGVPEHRILGTLFEGLVGVDTGTLEPVPAAAESWRVSEDGTVYEFTLRETGRWSNGDPVTAQDFAYAWRRILTPELASEYAYMLHCMKNARAFNAGELDDFSQVGVAALGARTLQVTLENPTPYFLQMQIHYTWFPVHRPTIERFGRLAERGTKWTRPGNLVGNGAFVLKRWVPNNIIEVVRNDRYWDAAQVRLNRILFYPIDDRLTEERSFRTGRLNLTESAPIAKIPVYQRDKPNLIHIDPYLGTYFYRVNVTRPPLDDPRVRRALAMALDRETIATKVLTGGQAPAGAFSVPGTAGYTSQAQIPYDVTEARRLLAEAGYPNGEGMRSIELLYNTSDDHKLIAEAIQQMWKKELGVDLTLANQDWKVYMASQNNLDYDICRAGWIGDFVDPINFLECFTSSNGNNRTGWGSPEFDAHIAAATRTVDVDARHECFQQAERLLLDAAPLIPIYYYTRAYFRSPAIKGWRSNLLGYISFKDLYIEEDAT